MPALGPSEWSVADVAAWLKDDLELPEGVVAAFKDNAVAGPGEHHSAISAAVLGRGWERQAEEVLTPTLASAPSRSGPQPQLTASALDTCADKPAGGASATHLPTRSPLAAAARPLCSCISCTFLCLPLCPADLLELSDEDLKQELGCKPLQVKPSRGACQAYMPPPGVSETPPSPSLPPAQARKIRHALEKMGFHRTPSGSAVMQQPAAEPAVPVAAPAPAAAAPIAAAVVPAAAAPPAGYPTAGYPPPAGEVAPSGAPPPAYPYPGERGANACALEPPAHIPHYPSLSPGRQAAWGGSRAGLLPGLGAHRPWLWLPRLTIPAAGARMLPRPCLQRPPPPPRRRHLRSRGPTRRQQRWC